MSGIPVSHGVPEPRLVKWLHLQRSSSGSGNLVGSVADGFWLFVCPLGAPGSEAWSLKIGPGGKPPWPVARLDGPEDWITGFVGMASFCVLKCPPGPLPGTNSACRQWWSCYWSILPNRRDQRRPPPETWHPRPVQLQSLTATARPATARQSASFLSRLVATPPVTTAPAEGVTPQ